MYVKCCVAAVKSRTDFISVLLYFFWSFGINDSNTFSIENWKALKTVLRGLERCCNFHCLSWTDSIEPSQLSFFFFFFFGLVALEGSTFYHECLTLVYFISNCIDSFVFFWVRLSWFFMFVVFYLYFNRCISGYGLSSVLSLSK